MRARRATATGYTGTNPLARTPADKVGGDGFGEPDHRALVRHRRNVSNGAYRGYRWGMCLRSRRLPFSVIKSLE